MYSLWKCALAYRIRHIKFHIDKVAALPPGQVLSPVCSGTRGTQIFFEMSSKHQPGI